MITHTYKRLVNTHTYKKLAMDGQVFNRGRGATYRFPGEVGGVHPEVAHVADQLSRPLGIPQQHDPRIDPCDPLGNHDHHAVR